MPLGSEPPSESVSQQRTVAFPRSSAEPLSDNVIPRSGAGKLGLPFVLLWMSETAFDIGAALMGFALGVWIFEQTGSAEQFAWGVLSSTVPALLMVPFAGALGDRFDRRLVIVWCDVSAALSVAALALVLALGRLETAHLYAFNAIVASVGALRNPAYKATISLIVPKDQLTRANGAMNLSEALLQTVAPLIAGHLMAAFGLGGVMVVQVVLALSGAAAVFAALSSVQRAFIHPNPGRRPDVWRASRDSLHSAWNYFRSEPLMVGLLAYVVLQESLLVFITAMITPLVLSTHSSETLGWVLAVGAMGGVVGSVLLIVFKVQRSLMTWVLVTDAVLSLAVTVAGFSSSSWVWCVCAFLAMAAGSASGVCAGALWMRKAPTATQGSVFALVDALHFAAACLVVMLGAIAGERLFEPALMPGGAWSDSLAKVIGSGPGRGYGLLFSLCGCVCALASVLALASRRMRELDDRVPDRDDVHTAIAPQYLAPAAAQGHPFPPP